VTLQLDADGHTQATKRVISGPIKTINIIPARATGRRQQPQALPAQNVKEISTPKRYIKEAV
jgi:hypothetical protein